MSGHLREHCSRILWNAVSAPSDVLVGSDQYEGAAIQFPSFGQGKIEDHQRHRLLACRFLEGSDA